MKNFTKFFSMLVVFMMGMVGTVSAEEGDLLYEGTFESKCHEGFFLTYAGSKLAVAEDAQTVWKLYESATPGAVVIQADNGLFVGHPTGTAATGVPLVGIEQAASFLFNIVDRDGVDFVTLEDTDPNEEYYSYMKYIIASMSGNKDVIGNSAYDTNDMGLWFFAAAEKVFPEAGKTYMIQPVWTDGAEAYLTHSEGQVVVVPGAPLQEEIAAYCWTFGEADADGNWPIYAIGTQDRLRFHPTNVSIAYVDENDKVWTVSNDVQNYDDTYTLQGSDDTNGGRSGVYIVASLSAKATPVVDRQMGIPSANASSSWSGDFRFTEVAADVVDEILGGGDEGGNEGGEGDNEEAKKEEAIMNLTMALQDADATLAKVQSVKEVRGAGLITSVNQLASNAPEVLEGSFEGLIDNNCRTFFHSNWSQEDVVDHHDLQVKLPENCEATQFMVRYTGRIGGNNCRPAAMNLYVGHKDEAGEIVWADAPFAQLTEADGLAVGTSQSPTDSVANTGQFWFSAPEVCDAIRFEVTKVYSQETESGSETPEEFLCFNYSEFQLYPAYIEKAQYEVDAALVAALEEALNNGRKANPGMSADELNALADALNDAIEPVEAAINEIFEDAATQLLIALQNGDATLAKTKGVKEVIGGKLITSADQLASNASDSEEGVGTHGLQVLIDEDPSTYWHSDWHNAVSDPHNLEVTLPENNAYTQFAVNYIGRVGGNNSAPLEMNLYGGKYVNGKLYWDEEPFTQLTEADGLGVDKMNHYGTDVAAHTGWFYFSTPIAYDVIRFEVTRAYNDAKDQIYFNYSEFQMYPAYIEEPELEADAELVEALEEAINNGRKATPETDPEEIIELANAINDAIKAIEGSVVDPVVDPNIEVLRGLMAEAHELIDGMEGKIGTLGYHVEDEYYELYETLETLDEIIDLPVDYWFQTPEFAVSYLQDLIEAYNNSDYVYPEAGKTYIIKAQYTNGELYLVNNNGAGAMSDTDPATYDDAADRAAYYWTLGEATEDGAHALYAIGSEKSFRFAPSGAGDGTYVDVNEEAWTISKANTCFENTFTLRSRDYAGGNGAERNGIYLECNASSTNRGMNPIAQPHAEYTSDYVFVEVSKDEVEGIITAISAVENGAASTTAKYYDLSGRRVLNPANGIFINSNGKKVIFK